MYETFLIEGNLDLESGRQMKRTDALRERNAGILRSVEQRVIDEVDHAAIQALESARTNMPRGESAAERVYAEATTLDAAWASALH
jgi:hypothetical protein